MLKDKNIRRKSSKNEKTKLPYQTPILVKYGSITALTAGRQGSIADNSSPGVKIR